MGGTSPRGAFDVFQQARVMDQLHFIEARRARRNAFPPAENVAVRKSAANSGQPSRRLRVAAPRIMLQVNLVEEVAQPMNTFRTLPRGGICQHLSVSSPARRFVKGIIPRDVCPPGSQVSELAPQSHGSGRRPGPCSSCDCPRTTPVRPCRVCSSDGLGVKIKDNHEVLK